MHNLTQTELSYLAGIWEAEGSFGIQQKTVNQKTAFSSYISLANTNQALMDRVIELLTKMEIEVYTRTRDRHIGRKQMSEVSISKLVGRENMLCTLLPYLEGKKAVATEVLKFVRHRISVEKNRISNKGSYSFSAIDNDIYSRTKELNARGSAKFGDVEPIYQEMLNVSEADLGYLSGLYDGEGCFTIAHVNNQLRLMCTFTNCDPNIVSRVISILKALGIKHRCKKGCRKNKQPAYVVGIYSLEAGYKLLSLLEDRVFGKKQIIGLVKNFVSKRMAKLSEVGRYHSIPYSTDEFALYDQVRIINQRGLRLPVEQSAEKQSRELLETPNSEMRRTISSEASKEERSTTMATASRIKRSEARDSLIRDEDIV